ncbi:MAG: hypothetical protein RQ824_09885 [bacterium]|nr:hypothetical protein [bacterium]
MLKQLKIYYIFVSMPFIALLFGAAIFSGAIKSTITSNPHPQINYTIFFIILSGGAIILFNARLLMREAKALAEFSKAIHAKTDLAALQEMAESYVGDIACLLQMVASSGGRSISHQEQIALEHELTNVNSRLNRRNSLPQYLTGLLVGMGLLGTFIGLLATLGDITALISSFADLDMSKADPIAVFRNMIEKMKAPMSSMAIAFSASMFGLLGSIILGLMMVGIRRLQGDIFSVLTSEIARHIEIALSFESVYFGGGELSKGEAGGDLTSRILLRIEERLAEAARSRQRALSSEIDDFKKQRADMLRALTEQTEANNNFRSELQQLTGQLGAIFNSMEKGGDEMSTQLSELAVSLEGDARETHKLLAMQVDEQKGLKAALDSYKNEPENNASSELQKLGVQFAGIFNNLEKDKAEIATRLTELTVNMAGDAKETHQLLARQLDEQKGLKETLDSYKIEERLNEAVRLQQRALSSEIDDFKKQRDDMLRAITGQTEASNNFRSELQQLGIRLADIFDTLEKGNDEISAQLTELTVHSSADAKELHVLLNTASNNVRSELQQLGSQLAAISNVMEKE